MSEFTKKKKFVCLVLARREEKELSTTGKLSSVDLGFFPETGDSDGRLTTQEVDEIYIGVQFIIFFVIFCTLHATCLTKM